MPESGPSAPSAPLEVAAPPQIQGETILSSLYQLLSNQNISPAYLHPYAPQPWKGKAKASSQSTIDEQLKLVEQLEAGLEISKGLLARRDGDWGRLSRSLKEIATHQSVLAPISNGLNLPSLPNISLPSPLHLSPPIKLLTSLAESLNLHTFLEDSQFGLLKSSLTIAGDRFVVDIDLEEDPAGGMEDDGNDEDTNMNTPLPLAVEVSGLGTGMDPEKRTERGKVRLSKVGVNHVTKDEGTGKSDWICTCLKEALEEYLSIWNTPSEGTLVEMGIRGKELFGRIERLREMLEMIQLLDGVSTPSKISSTEVEDKSSNNQGTTVFSELEDIAKAIDGLLHEDQPFIYTSSSNHVFPSLKLLRGDNPPIFHIRPLRVDEVVGDLHTSGLGENDEAMDNIFPAGWVLEYVSKPGDIIDGLVVRRNWLSGEETDGTNQWDGSLKIENALYQGSSAQSGFPYNATFVCSASSKGGISQHWSMSLPGPEAFIVGRIGLPRSKDHFVSLINRLAGQARLNHLFSDIFKSSRLQPTSIDDVEDDDNETLESLLSAPRATPVNVSLGDSSMRISFPVHRNTQKPTFITLSITTTTTKPGNPITTNWTSRGEAISTEESRRIDEIIKEYSTPGSGSLLIETIERLLMTINHVSDVSG